VSEIVHKYKGVLSYRDLVKVREPGEFIAQQPSLELRAVVESRTREVDAAWLSVILDPYTNPWHLHVEVVENYMPPFPRPDTKPSIQVRWGDSFLRYARGVFQPWFWDIYGDEFYSVQRAWLSVAQAPAPPSMTYRNKGAPET